MHEVGGWALVYFLAEVLIGRMIVLNLVLAVVLSNDSIGVTMRDDKMRMYLVSVYEKIMTRAAFKRWKHGRHDPFLYETKEMIQAQEEGNARPRILNAKIYGNSLKELDDTRNRRNSWLRALHEIHQEHMTLDELENVARTWDCGNGACPPRLSSHPQRCQSQALNSVGG